MAGQRIKPPEFEDNRAAQHHGDGEQVPLNFQPAIGADVQPVADKSIARRDHGSGHHGKGSYSPEFVADPVNPKREFK